MIRIIILGQPFWACRLAGFLNSRREDMAAEFLPPNALWTRKGLGKVRKASIIMRMGYRPGGPTWRGRAFDALWSLLRTLNPRAKGVHYWIGTDVMYTLQDFRTGRLRRGPMVRAQRDLHWADAPWLVEELAEVGLASHYVALPVPLGDVEPPASLPAPFTVLTYLPDARPDFYDGPTILEAARALPDVAFEVIGGTGPWAKDPPPNVKFFGWQKDIRPFLARAAVVVRLVAHDGSGGTVREALEAGRHVIYSEVMPWVTFVPYQDLPALTQALRSMRDQFEAGRLLPNVAGHDYVQKTFDLETCLNTYLADLRALLGPAVPENPRP